MNEEEKREIFLKRIIDLKEALITARESIKMANNNLEIVDNAINSAINHFENIDEFIDLFDNFILNLNLFSDFFKETFIDFSKLCRKQNPKFNLGRV